MSEEYMKERQVAIECVRLASQVTQAVFKRLVAEKDKMTVTKGDFSPVTAGDLACQAVVNTLLRRHFPNDPVVGEEDAAHLRTAEGAALCETVVTMANTVLSPPLTTDEVLDAIDYGMYSGGGKGRHWTLDPIDGTKGFLRQEQYAVCLALIHDGHVKVGVMGCPNLPRVPSDLSLGNGALFVAVKGQGAFQRALEDPTETRIQVSSISSPADARFCESVESGHSNHSDSDTIAKLLGITTPPIRMDSQCKYASVARGDASIYLRLPTIKGYEEKIWDHASGNLLIEEAGGKVTDVKGKSLDFSIGRTLKANTGVIATNGPIHQAVVDAVMAVLYPPTNL